jgi:hypothetical protein
MTMTLVEEWKSLIADVRDVGLNIFATAELRKTERGFADDKFLGLTLLARLER